ncbi:MAG: polyprenyl synthetase family protein [Thermoleophilia bacterium]|nr:polyprenyl synthetase family protein [Thermoleophilia bacterium]
MSTVLPPRIRTYGPWLARCEERLADIVGEGRPIVAEPATETLIAGGKRLRPLLVYCCAAPENGNGAAITSAAAAVELVHMATLVHDDVLDDADLRRGHPTVLNRHGRERAVETGDHLFALAFGELAAAGSPDAVSILAQASLELSQGEISQDSRARDLSLSAEDYLDRVRLKTAALFSAACRLGGQMGATTRASDLLGEFGQLIGVAFQIFDDILDLTGTTDTTGKPRGADLRDGTVTLPMIRAMRQDPELVEAISAAMQGEGLEQTCDRLAVHPGTSVARQEAVRLVERAHRIAGSGGLGGADATALAEIAEGVVDRYA